MVKIMNLCFRIAFSFTSLCLLFQPDSYCIRGVIKNEVCGLRSLVGAICIYIDTVFFWWERKNGSDEITKVMGKWKGKEKGNWIQNRYKQITKRMVIKMVLAAPLLVRKKR